MPKLELTTRHGPPVPALLDGARSTISVYPTPAVCNQNTVTDTALDDIPDLPVMDKLYTPPTIDELGKPISYLVCETIPGTDGI
ncbi:hypothetical protein CHS0354_018760 [Potamilus streckersoni]|uniref:Uncharacterized protein n=1 Tax=Potamilus streckersoni TaxID=2493646 RepID=A0AAE0W644_9BIVA|nr:hypothetical protein CHS0354_018760 [Potamilus streckersoni]